MLEGVRMDHLAQYLAECSDAWVEPIVRVPGVEQLIGLAGPGAPRVPEFAVCEVATAMGLSQAAASGLCADVLDLVFRLPGVAGCVRCGDLSFARARLIARRTRELSAEQAGLVAASVMRTRVSARGAVPVASLVPMGRLRALVDHAVLSVRAPGSLAQAEARVAQSLFVELVGSADGGTDVAARLATADAARLDARLDQVAGWLVQVGDGRPKAVLRAVALGLLADPAMLKALDGLRREPANEAPTHRLERGSIPTPPDGGSEAAGVDDEVRELLATLPAPPDLYLLPDAGAAQLDLGPPGRGDPHRTASGGARPVSTDDSGPATPRTDPRHREQHHPPPRPGGVAGLPEEVLERLAGLRSTVLYVHLDQASGTWCEERGGALSREQARAIVGHSQVSVRPVLDLGEELTYTGYAAPPRLREQLSLLNTGRCTFPSCERLARPGDVDHQQPDPRGNSSVNSSGRRGWADSDADLRAATSPGTRSSNTHLLCRKHHRAKTHGDWRVAEPAPGIWLWRSASGACYLVTNGTTTMLNGLGNQAAAGDHTGRNLLECEVTHGFAAVG